MFNINEQVPKGEEFTEKARYIIDWKNKKNFINNIKNKVIIRRI